MGTNRTTPFDTLAQALAEGERERAAIYEHVPGILFYVSVEPPGEFRFLAMSDAGLQAMGLTRDRVVGSLVRDVIPSASRDTVIGHYREAIRTGRTVQWKEVSDYPAGQRVGDVAVTPLFDSDGAVTHLIGIVHDITDREMLARMGRDREDRLAFLLRLDDRLRSLTEPALIQETAARLLGEHLQVTRVGYAEIGPHGFTIRREYLNGVAPLEQGPKGDFGAALSEGFRRGETVVVHDVDTDPRLTDDERRTMRARQIGAFVGVTLVKDERLVAAFGANHVNPRRWAPVEIELVRDVAVRTWDAVERTRAEAVARERAQREHQALDASAGGSWTWDTRTNRIDWDDRLRTLYGFAPDERPSFEAWVSRVHDEDRAPVVAVCSEMMQATRETWDCTFRIVRPDGSVSWIQSLGRADRFADGGFILSGLELDVTERRRAEDAQRLQRDEEHGRTLRTLLETASQGIVSVDAAGLIVTANRAFAVIFGFTADELIGQPIGRLMSSALGDTSAPAGVCAVGVRKDGMPVPIEVTVTHVPTPNGRRTFAFVTDITERQRAATALRERTSELEYRTTQLRRLASDLTLAEQRAREDIAKTLHDGLQQLLLVAAMNLQQISNRQSDGGALSSDLLVEARRHLDDAIAAARSLSVDVFPPVLQRAGLPAALTWLANWARDTYKVDVAIVADPQADSERKDVRTLLFESVRELLINTVKHARTDRVTLDLTLDDGQIAITVSDRGVGFDPARLEDRSNATEMGWGLFSIQERLMLLGGRVTIDSAPGQGTRVRLVAPRGTHPRARKHERRASADALRILIVDDHAEVRQALRQALDDRPQLRVVGEASDGLEAIASAHTLRPDVVLMDVVMPHMDGIEATARIRVELPDAIVFGMSMSATDETIRAIEQAGASAFFAKGTGTLRMIDQLVLLYQARADRTREHA